MQRRTAAPPARRSLQDLSAGLFSLILSLRSSHDYGAEQELRQRILGYLSGIEREGLAAGIPRQDVEMIKFPLVAFIDETIINSEWSFRERWRDRPLQLELFGERMAGTRFFEYLEQVRRVGHERREVLEIYHLCLTLGFEGQYRIADRDRLPHILAEVRRELGYDPQDRREIRLAPNGKRRDSPTAGIRDIFPFWRVAGIAAGSLLVLFVIFWIWVDRALEQALKALPPPAL
jgi:type VI secretion system protein ImpK